MDHETYPMIPVQDAIRTVMRETARILLNDKKANPTELISLSSTPLSTLLNCTLDEDVLMAEPGYPPYNASIMDGYAIRTGEHFTTQDAMLADTNNSWTHRVVDNVYAGDCDRKPPTALHQGEEKNDTIPSAYAYYITTGAVVPESCNCVVPIEECLVSSCTTKIRIQPSANLKHHQWIRPVGCDISPSTVVLPKGHNIDPIAIGLAKQSGVEYIKVKRRTRVGVMSTGNELIIKTNDDNPVGHTQKGKIPDVNRPVLLSILATSLFQNICEPIDLGMVRDDDVDAMVETFEAALERCDVIITTGGVSMGQTDIIEHVLVDRCGGNLHFGRMHMKPGKPTTFVTIPPHKQMMDGNNGDNTTKIVFALPGNPCSAVVCTQLLVKPCLDLYFHGILDHHKSFNMNDAIKEEQKLEEIVNSSFVHPEIEAILSHDIKLDAKRPEYHRVVLIKSTSSSDGIYHASSTGVQRSSRLMSLRDAQGLLLLPHIKGNKTIARQGESYHVLLMNNSLGVQSIQIRDSVHMNGNNGKTMKVGIIEVIPSKYIKDLSNVETVCSEIQKALNGSDTNVIVVTKRVFSDSLDTLYSYVVDEMSDDVDLIVVSCVTFDGSFQYHLDVTSTLRQRLSKVAKSMALQARQGSASQDPSTALFEVTVGHVPRIQQHGSMLICVQDKGVRGALSNVRGLIKHGLRISAGK
ncbi:MAG: molybdopterin molybdotransferase [Bacillariaceae sp.]|jgi:molybdopterin molybdotransferase